MSSSLPSQCQTVRIINFISYDIKITWDTCEKADTKSAYYKHNDKEASKNCKQKYV